MNDCNCNPKPCDTCHQDRCGHCEQKCKCPMPFLAIEQLPDNLSVLRFNIDGKRADYDFSNLIYQTQSDTTLVADAINRLLTYQAERHTDTITSRELGAILHLAEIGDVDAKGAQTGSMLTYQKDSDCSAGCVGLHDSWKVWNALDEQTSSATYPFVFGADGSAYTIERPADPNQFYMLGWNGKNQVSYSQVQTVTSAPVDTNNKKLRLYLDPNTREIVAVEES